MKIAILIDSSAGIKDVKNYKDMYLVPLMITKEDGEQISDDENFESNEFYQLHEKQLLKTSMSIPGTMLGKWDELLKEYDNVVCLLLSKGLSGQFETYRMFSQQEEYLNKVFVVDTNGVSIILKQQVLDTLELVKQGKTGQEICQIIESRNKNFNCFIVPKTLDQLVRGGRISKAAASMAKLLKINPILRYDGEIDKEDKTRTFKKAIETAIDLLKKKTKSTTLQVDFSYSRTEEETLEFVKKTIIEKGFTIRLQDDIPNTITCHTGKDTFAIAIWDDNLN
ncbi:fatty acid-binding protein DegV [Spiroplasma gladiatoris]|uniref:Fatty acid-binding protein DegV n=1 Tax=Spiroplasma gladiatoris TaxID=2143 RepID=A0A4P7AKJ6_9MOLU|nr:DegV family protein [Spiroplasma gladiatoris]QBQ08080.1 fatty acid-binding protein DegV [Spiroplasma gladiatoris]